LINSSNNLTFMCHSNNLELMKRKLFAQTL